jgi:genome maintenance exonuclease 1
LSLIEQKYNYQKLSRKNINGKRKYFTPEGNAVASVTTILDATADKTGLLEWRKRVGETRANQITTEAAGIGTRLHKYIENFVETGEWAEPGSNPYSKKAHAMATVIKEKAFSDITSIWGSEVSLYMPNMYAGTTDLVGTYKGQPAILDFKQTNKPKKGEWVENYFLQLVAYALAHNEIYGTDIQEGHIFMCTRGDDPIELGGEEYQQFDISPQPDPYFGKTFDDWKYEWWNRVYTYYEKYA